MPPRSDNNLLILRREKKYTSQNVRANMQKYVNIKESKADLNNLLTEFTETIDELKTPPTKLDHLKKNKDLFAVVKAKLPALAARREPIKKKFAFIQDQETNDGSTELSEEDKAKLEGLEEAWKKF